MKKRIKVKVQGLNLNLSGFSNSKTGIMKYARLAFSDNTEVLKTNHISLSKKQLNDLCNNNGVFIKDREVANVAAWITLASYLQHPTLAEVEIEEREDVTTEIEGKSITIKGSMNIQVVKLHYHPEVREKMLTKAIEAEKEREKSLFADFVWDFDELVFTSEDDKNVKEESKEESKEEVLEA